MQISKNFQVYKSSAGSGKTFTLARKYLKLILGNSEPDYFKHILAITFTVKAAREMKDRILEYLSAFAGNEHERDDLDTMLSLIKHDTGLSEKVIKIRSQQALNRILQHYGEFSVMTIDKFVHGLVRTFSTDLGLSHDFDVEINQDQITDRVVSELFDQVGEHQDITKIIMAFIQHQHSNDKSWNISKSIEALVYELTSEDFFLSARDFEKLDWNNTHEILGCIDERIKNCRNDVEQIGSEALIQAEKLGLTQADFYYGKSGIYGYFKNAQEGKFESIISPNSRVLATIEEGKWESSKAGENISEIVPIWEKLYQRIYKLKPEVEKCLLLVSIKDQVFRMALIGHLRQLVKAIKEDENQQLLSDFYQLLSDQFSDESTPFIYERIGNKYRHVMIDEFQDTSRLQWETLLPLIENSIAEGNSTLIVGDAKQSIYRFRGSEPKQFVELPHVNRDSQLLFASEFEAHVLESNYRSCRTIVDFNNKFFKSLSAILPEQLRITYDTLYQNPIDPSSGHVGIHTVDTTLDNDTSSVFYQQIERKISRYLHSGQFKAKDICLMFRTNAEASIITSKLIEAGYSVSSSESLLLKNNAEVLLLIYTLKCLREPSNYFAIQQWLSRAAQCNILTDNHHSLSKKSYKEKWSFHRLIEHLKYKMPPRHRLSNSFQTMHDFARIFGFNLQGAFIKRLCDHALEYEQSKIKFKESYLNYWDSTSPKLSIDSPIMTDAITVMTIHKSKGLEFPAVLACLPELKSKSFTKKYMWVKNSFDIPHLSSVYLNISSLKNTSLHDIYEMESNLSLLDEINTLYVAMTRASKSLDVFVKMKKNKNNDEKKPHSSELDFITEWTEWDSQNGQLLIDN